MMKYLSRASTLALLLVLGPLAARAEEAPPLAPPLPAPLGAPQAAGTEEIGAWKLDTFKLPGKDETICVTTRTFDNGDRLGFILGEKGRGIIYGQKGLKAPDGSQMDFGFSVDGRPPLGLHGRAYDPTSIMSTPLPSPEGEKLLAVFARGSKAVIGSNSLKMRSGELDLTGAGAAIKALDACGTANNIQVVKIDLPPAGTPAPAGTGAAVAGNTFDDDGKAAPAPAAPTPAAPAPAPAAEAEPTPVEVAIREAIAAEAKKRSAGVGYAVALPKDVTGDGKEDVVLVFVLLEGKEKKGYVTVLKTVGVNSFTRLNTVALGGIPTNDPVIFTPTGIVVTLEGGSAKKPNEVDVLITADKLTVKKK